MGARADGQMNERRAAFFFLAPALAVILLFFLIPVLASLLLSLTDFDIYALADIHNIRLIGLRNYQQLLAHPKAARWKPLFRTVYFAPVVTTVVAVAVVWKYLYHPRFGLLNRMLEIIGIGAIDWLCDPKWAMPAIILLAVWKHFGHTMIIFVAVLPAIPGGVV